MNDIEKEIEEDFEEEKEDVIVEEVKEDITIEEEKEEEETIKPKLNYNRYDNKKKIIIYILIGIISLAIIGAVIYLITNNKETKEVPKENNKEVEEPVKEEKTKLYYVSCDDNTSLLNVRNSTSGDIVDGLSCFHEVKVEEELEKTDTCDKWYKISYKKRDNNYTGYACGTYIKESTISNETYKLVNELIDKANDYYENSRVMPYCGKTSDSKKVTFNEDGGFEGEYVKSEYKSINELKEYLNSFLSSSLIDSKLELSDYDNPKMYDNYYEIDNNLYCRKYSGKGWLTLYTGNYNIEITSNDENKIESKISYEYINQKTFEDPERECDLNNISKCSNYDFEYIIGKVVVEKKDNNYIITKMDFHK